MIAKAVAHELVLRSAEVRGVSVAEALEHSAFLNVKGPELLNKYVGETERSIRLVFERAREKAAADHPVVIFFDEMEALFRTRGTGMSSDVETTIVPQLLAEIDGVEGLDNVIVIGASNREDMIDPAILRPGRLDVKIRVPPQCEGRREILGSYPTTRCRCAGPSQQLLDLQGEIYDDSPASAFVRVNTPMAADTSPGLRLRRDPAQHRGPREEARGHDDSSPVSSAWVPSTCRTPYADSSGTGHALASHPGTGPPRAAGQRQAARQAVVSSGGRSREGRPRPGHRGGPVMNDAMGGAARRPTSPRSQAGDGDRTGSVVMRPRGPCPLRRRSSSCCPTW